MHQLQFQKPFGWTFEDFSNLPIPRRFFFRFLFSCSAVRAIFQKLTAHARQPEAHCFYLNMSAVQDSDEKSEITVQSNVSSSADGELAMTKDHLNRLVSNCKHKYAF